MPHETGPFRANGMRPSGLAIGKVTRVEATRRVLDYLSRQAEVGHGLNWDDFAPGEREAWVNALSKVYSDASREAAKAAVTELAEYEELALLLHCRKCGAGEEEACRDLRRKFITHVKHPHQERLDDMEAAL